MKKIALSFIATALSLAGMAQSVYLSEARSNPFERNLFIDDSGSTFRYTAFYSGYSQPGKDINVEFCVDAAKTAEFNSANGTTYKILPKGSYTMDLSSATIRRGSVSATPGEVKVTGKGKLKPFEKYILPVSVKTDGDNVGADPALSTVYYIIHAVPAPGSIARRQIGRLPSGTESVFGSLGGKCLTATAGNGALTVYRYNGGSLGKGAPLSGSENLKDMDIVVNFRDRYLVGLNCKAGNGQLCGFPLSADGRSIGAMDKIFGTSGYNIFSGIIPYGNTLYCLKPSGELMMYSLSDDLEWGRVSSLGSGWKYPVIFGYKDSLIGVDSNGDMWKYPVLADGQTGLAQKIGTGWNIFTHVVVSGSDLLCVDREGAVWQIKFNDQGFWAM